MGDEDFEAMMLAADIPAFSGRPSPGSWLDVTARRVAVFLDDLGVVPENEDLAYLMLVREVRMGVRHIMEAKRVSRPAAELYMNEYVLRALAQNIADEYAAGSGERLAAAEVSIVDPFDDPVGVPVRLNVWVQTVSVLLLSANSLRSTSDGFADVLAVNASHMMMVTVRETVSPLEEGTLIVVPVAGAESIIAVLNVAANELAKRPDEPDGAELAELAATFVMMATSLQEVLEPDYRDRMGPRTYPTKR